MRTDHPIRLSTVLLMSLSILLPFESATAAEGHSRGGTHHFLPHWSKTLDDEQKRAIDEMHLRLDREIAPLKAEAALKEKELNVLVTRDSPDAAAVDARIDEIVSLKRRILKARYAHIVEMRALLDPAQRISYDMGVLKRTGID